MNMVGAGQRGTGFNEFCTPPSGVCSLLSAARMANGHGHIRADERFKCSPMCGLFSDDVRQVTGQLGDLLLVLNFLIHGYHLGSATKSTAGEALVVFRARPKCWPGGAVQARCLHGVVPMRLHYTPSEVRARLMNDPFTRKRWWRIRQSTALADLPQPVFTDGPGRSARSTRTRCSHLIQPATHAKSAKHVAQGGSRHWTRLIHGQQFHQVGRASLMHQAHDGLLTLSE